MNRHEHTTAYDRLCREQAAAWRWHLYWRPLLRFGACVAVLLLLAWAMLHGGRGCGDVAFGDTSAPRRASVAAAPERPGQPGQPVTRPVVGSRVARVARLWRPEYRGDATELADLGRAVRVACDGTPDAFPDHARCPWLLLALGWRESAWQPEAVGAPPYRARGLWQVHGVARMGWSDAELLRVGPSARVAAAWLAHLAFGCGRYSGRSDYHERVVSAYVGAGCRPSAAARRVWRWVDDVEGVAAQVRRLGGGA